VKRRYRLSGADQAGGRFTMYVFYLGAAIRPSGCHAATQLRRSMVFQGYWGVDFVARITNVQSSVPLVAQTPLVSSIVLPVYWIPRL